MSPAIHKRKLENIRSLLLRFDDSQMERINTVEVCAAIQDIELALKMKRSVVVNRKRVKSKKAERQDEWAQIREKVFKRAGGVCENCGECSESLEPDHMFGRGGGRKSLESAYTVWALCGHCHYAKTINHGGAHCWLETFIRFCGRWIKADPDHCAGYAQAANIARARLDSLRIQGRAE